VDEFQSLPPLILASTSSYRRALLERLGLAFATHSPGVAESRLPGEAPAERALRLAQAKADAVANQHPRALVIGSDQVASAAGSILDKPGTRARAHAQLAQLSGAMAQFHTACALVCRERSHSSTHLDTTTVQFRTLSGAEVERYLAREPALDCAGSFKAEALGISLLERIDSTDPTALIGLPLIWLAQALRQAGFPLP
jgi:septum formation protein